MKMPEEIKEKFRIFRKDCELKTAFRHSQMQNAFLTQRRKVDEAQRKQALFLTWSLCAFAPLR